MDNYVPPPTVTSFVFSPAASEAASEADDDCEKDDDSYLSVDSTGNSRASNGDSYSDDRPDESTWQNAPRPPQHRLHEQQFRLRQSQSQQYYRHPYPTQQRQQVHHTADNIDNGRKLPSHMEDHHHRTSSLNSAASPISNGSIVQPHSSAREHHSSAIERKMHHRHGQRKSIDCENRFDMPHLTTKQWYKTMFRTTADMEAYPPSHTKGHAFLQAIWLAAAAYRCPIVSTGSKMVDHVKRMIVSGSRYSTGRNTSKNVSIASILQRRKKKNYNQRVSKVSSSATFKSGKTSACHLPGQQLPTIGEIRSARANSTIKSDAADPVAANASIIVPHPQHEKAAQVWIPQVHAKFMQSPQLSAAAPSSSTLQRNSDNGCTDHNGGDNFPERVPLYSRSPCKDSRSPCSVGGVSDDASLHGL